MPRPRLEHLAVAALFVLLGGAGAALGQGPPPAPPKDARKLPRQKPDTRPPPRIIRLKPGQTRITPDQLRSAPTPAQRAVQHRKNPTPRPVKPAPPPMMAPGLSQYRLRNLPRARPPEPAPPALAPTAPD